MGGVCDEIKAQHRAEVGNRLGDDYPSWFFPEVHLSGLLGRKHKEFHPSETEGSSPIRISTW